MHNWRLIVIFVAAVSFAASAHAQSELIESVESLEAADDASSLESFEQITDGIAEDDFTSAEWSDPDLPNLVDVSVDDASAPSSSWFAGAELLRLKPRYSHGRIDGKDYVNTPLLSVLDAGVYKDDPANAPRAFVGWSVGGWGVRGRFWQFENGGLVTPEHRDSMRWGLDATRFDLDAYRQFQFKRGSIAVGANLTKSLSEN